MSELSELIDEIRSLKQRVADLERQEDIPFVTGTSLTVDDLIVNTSIDLNGTLDISGNMFNIGGNVVVNDQLNVNQNLVVTGESFLYGNVSDPGGDLTLNDNVTLSGDLHITGNIDNTGGNVSVNDNLDVTGNLEVDGSVGIGTSSLTDKLNISGAGPVRLRITDTDDSRPALVEMDSSVFTIWSAGASANAGEIVFRTGSGSGTERLRITGAGDVYSVAWTDYSATSTIVGWSSFTTKILRYKKIGKTVFVEFRLVGTSNATTTTFTLPVAPWAGGSAIYMPTIRIQDNGGAYAIGMLQYTHSSSTVTIFSSVTGSTWTASGTKFVSGQFWYEAA